MTYRFAPVLLAGLSACGGSSLPSGSGVIGSAGGQAEAGTSASVVIPPGALVATNGQTCQGTTGQPGWGACGFP